MVAVLVISESDKAAAQAVIAHAEANVVTLAQLQAIDKGQIDAVGDNPQNSIELILGYRAVFSIDEQKGGQVRHLSVSHQDLYQPPIEAVRMIMDLFDFKFALEQCIVWEEKVGNARNAINICEPLKDENWDKFMKKEGPQ
jgi:hypothetical protein